MELWNKIRLFGICFILSIITNLPSGFTNAFVNTAVDELRAFIRESYERREWTVSDSMESIIRSSILNCWYVSQMISFIISPYFTDTHGRKISYLIANTVMTLGAVVQYFGIISYFPELLILGRCMAALAAPLADAALILYIQESSPAELRATFSYLGQTGYGISCIIGMIFGMKAVFGNSLPTILLCAIVPGIPFTLFLLLIPETPKYLMIVKKNRNAALKSLEYFQGKKEENQKLLDVFLLENEQDDHGKKSTISKLLTTWQLRQAVFISCAILLFQLPFYATLQSSTYFFQHIKINSNIAQLASTLIMVIITIASLVGSAFIDRYPRRFLVLTFGIFSNIFLIGFVLFSSLSDTIQGIKYAAAAALLMYSVTFGGVLGPVSIFVAPELVVQKHKSKIFCLCFAINNCLIAITSFVATSMYQFIGAYIFIPLFIIPSSFALVYLYFRLPETLKKETHEIIALMASKRPQLQSADYNDNFSNN